MSDSSRRLSRFSARPSKPAPVIVVILFFLIGVGLTWILQGMIRGEIAFERSAQIAQRRVVALKESWGGSHNTTLVYAPVFRFTTPDGRMVDAVSDDASAPPAWSVGEAAQLLYDPANPTHAAPNSLRGRWSASALLGVVTLSFFAAGILGLRTRRWRLF